MGTLRRICLIAISIALASGCYARRIYDIETRQDNLEWRMATLQDSLDSIARTTAHLDSTVGGRSVSTRTTGARMESRMDDIETRLEMLESLVKETRYKVSQMSLKGPRPSVPETSAVAGEEPVDTSVVVSAVAQDIYETAYVDFTKGDFDGAVAGFRDFVSRFPVNDFSDDAQFMTGQSFYARGDYASAIPEYRKVLDRYPSGDRVPQAMYFLGLSYLKIDDPDTAREYFKILSARYPKAAEGDRAKAMLDSLRIDSRYRGD